MSQMFFLDIKKLSFLITENNITKIYNTDTAMLQLSLKVCITIINCPGKDWHFCHLNYSIFKNDNEKCNVTGNSTLSAYAAYGLVDCQDDKL